MERFPFRSVAGVVMILSIIVGCASQNSQVKNYIFHNKEARRLFVKGVSYEKEKKFDVAIFHYGLSIGLEPTPMALANRGYLLTQEGRYEEAMADFDQAISRAPGYLESYLYRAELWIRQKEFGNAFDDYNRAVDIDPKSPYAYNNRGFFNWVYARDYPAAFKDFTKAIELDPKMPENYLDRAAVRKLLGQEMTAVYDDLSKAIEHNRYYKKAYFVRALEYALNDNVYAARMDCRRVLQLDRNESIYTPVAEGYLALAEIQEGLTKSKYNAEKFQKKAIALLDDAIEKMNRFGPEDIQDIWPAGSGNLYNKLRSEQYYFRAMAKLALDDYEGAMSDISFALVLQPGDKKALGLKGQTVRLLGEDKN